MGGLQLRLRQGHYNSGIFCSSTSVQSMQLELFFSVTSLDLNPAGGLLVTGSGDGYVRTCKFTFPI